MIRISQLKLPCGHSRGELENRVRKTLRLGGGEPLKIVIRKHSIDARKKPQLFDIYTVDADLGIGLNAEKSASRNSAAKTFQQYSRPNTDFPRREARRWKSGLWWSEPGPPGFSAL